MSKTKTRTQTRTARVVDVPEDNAPETAEEYAAAERAHDVCTPMGRDIAAQWGFDPADYAGPVVGEHAVALDTGACRAAGDMQWLNFRLANGRALDVGLLMRTSNPKAAWAVDANRCTLAKVLALAEGGGFLATFGRKGGYATLDRVAPMPRTLRETSGR